VTAALKFAADEAGAAMVEMSIVIVLLLTLVLGFVDFGYAFYQWNAANKAVQTGARLASVSNPVVVSPIISSAATSDLSLVGVQMAPGSYSFSCTSTTCTGTGTPGFSQAAFDTIFEGSATRPGMVDIFPDLARTEVRIEYIATGLGFWTRPGGAIPTIRVSIINHPFQFFFLGGLLSFANITMPSMISTVTGEDLSSAAPL
jgi:Flp pilus assembly protein TadG